MTTRVLLVDTEIGFMLKLKEALEQTGAFKVSVAANVPGAVEHLKMASHRCALVAFDLPAWDIVEVLRELRSIQPDIAVIAMPNTDAEEDRVHFLDVQSWLRKPFTARDASPSIQSAIARVSRAPEASAPIDTPPSRPAEPVDMLGDAPPPGDSLDLDALDSSGQPQPNRLFRGYQAPDGASILDEFAALERAQTDALSPLDMRESGGSGLLDDDYGALSTQSLEQPDPRAPRFPATLDEELTAYPQIDLPQDYGQRGQPLFADETHSLESQEPEPPPTRDLAGAAPAAKLTWSPSEPPPTRDLADDARKAAAPDYPQVDLVGDAAHLADAARLIEWDTPDTGDLPALESLDLTPPPAGAFDLDGTDFGEFDYENMGLDAVDLSGDEVTGALSAPLSGTVIDRWTDADDEPSPDLDEVQAAATTIPEPGAPDSDTADSDAADSDASDLGADYELPDALDWFRNLPPSVDPLSAAGLFTTGPTPPPPPAEERAEPEIESVEDLFDAIYSDANYADDAPLLPPDLPDDLSAFQTDEEYLPGAWGEPEITPPSADDTGTLAGAWEEPGIHITAPDGSDFLDEIFGESEVVTEPEGMGEDQDWGEPEITPPGPDDVADLLAPLSGFARSEIDATRPLDPTEPFPGLEDMAMFEAPVTPPFVLDDQPADEHEEAIRDVLDAVSDVSRRGETRALPDLGTAAADAGSLHDLAFNDLVESLRAAPPDSPRRTALEDLFAALEQDIQAASTPAASAQSSAEPPSAIDSVLNVIRSGPPPAEAEEIVVESGESELRDATIGDVIQGLFDPSFEGVLATLAGEDIADDSFQEPTYESLDAEPDRRRRIPQEPRDSASYPATTALSAVRGAQDQPGEFSLDALLKKIETDLAGPRRPRLKPLPSWSTRPRPAEKSPQIDQMEALFNRFERVEQVLKPAAPVEDTRFQSLFEEFENLTPESIVPSPLAHETAQDAAPPPDLLAEADEYGDPFAVADARALRAEADARALRAEADARADWELEPPDSIAPPPSEFAREYRAEQAGEAEPADAEIEALDEAEVVPDLTTPSFVEDYHMLELQDTDTRPMPIDAGANIDTDFQPEMAEAGYAAPGGPGAEWDTDQDEEQAVEQVIDQYAAQRERISDHIPPDLAAALGELADQLTALPDKETEHVQPAAAPDMPPEWFDFTPADEFDLTPADDADFVEVPADTAAMILGGTGDERRFMSAEELAAEAAAPAMAGEFAAEEAEAARAALPAEEQPEAALEAEAGEAPLDRDALAEIAVALTEYALESSAQAVMLAQPGDVVAVSGDLPETAERRLFQIVDTAWNEAPDSGALIRFINLPGAGEFLLYSTLVESDEAGDLSLSMIFHVDTPVRLIRRQAQRLSEALALVPEESAPDQEPPAARTMVSRPTDLRPPAGLREAIAEQQAAAPAESVPERPAEDIATTTAFVCAWLPADPTLELRGELAEALAFWLDEITRANGWPVEECQVGPEVVLMTLRIPEKLLADEVIARLMDETTARCAEHFPDVLAEGAPLWTDGYYLVTPPRPLTEREIGRFITAQRNAQARP